MRHCELTSEPIDATAVLGAVAAPGAGGQVLFVGTVRDHDTQAGGKRVIALEYEAHPAAKAALWEVGAKIAARHPAVVGVAIEHRVGRLAVGDTAVAVAASAAHRAEAFAACEALIDIIKADAPIWKRQVYADGTSDWVNCA